MFGRRHDKNGELLYLARLQARFGRSAARAAWIAVVVALLVGVVTAALTILPKTDTSHRSSSPAGVSISAVRAAGSCTSSYVFAGDPAKLPSLPRPTDSNYEEEWGNWGPLHGAADAEWTDVFIVVTSKDERPVVLTRLDVDVTRRDPVRGIQVTNACGGPTEARYIQYDLDASPPKVIASNRDVATIGASDVKVSPLTFPYEVTNTDTAKILLRASARTCSCQWRARLSWQAGGSSGVVQIDLNGVPFRTSGDIGTRRCTPNLDMPLNACVSAP